MISLYDRLLSLGMEPDDFPEGDDGHRQLPLVVPHPETGAWHFMGISRRVPVAVAIPIGARMMLDLLPFAAIVNMTVLDHGTQDGRPIIAVADTDGQEPGRWIPLHSLTALPDRLTIDTTPRRDNRGNV